MHNLKRKKNKFPSKTKFVQFQPFGCVYFKNQDALFIDLLFRLLAYKLTFFPTLTGNRDNALYDNFQNTEEEGMCCKL